MNTDNVIPFPKGNPSSISTEKEEATKNLIEGREAIAGQVSEDLFDIVLNALQQYRVYKTTDLDETSQKDLFALQEMIGAVVFRQNNLVHPFQEIIDSSIRVTDDEPVETISFTPDFDDETDEETTT